MRVSESAAGPVYNPLAKLLHWATAVLIVLQLGIGWTMPDIHRDTRPEGLIRAHLLVGALIVLVVAARVLWRVARPPTGAAAGSAAARRLAQGTHVLLYLLMVVVPLLGWGNADSRNWVAGTPSLHLPHFMAAGSPSGHQMGDVHGALAIALAILIGLHVAAGLYHHLVRRDGTLARML